MDKYIFNPFADAEEIQAEEESSDCWEALPGRDDVESCSNISDEATTSTPSAPSSPGTPSTAATSET
jgi:hypothetical protein